MLTKALFYLTMVLVLPALGLGSLMAICSYYLEWELDLTVLGIMAFVFIGYAHHCAVPYFKHTFWGHRLPARIIFRECFWLCACSFGPPYVAVLAYRVSLFLHAPGIPFSGMNNLAPEQAAAHGTSWTIAMAVMLLGWPLMFWLAGEVSEAEEARQVTRRGRSVSDRDWSSYEN